MIDSRTPPLWKGTITELLDLLIKIAQDNLKIKTSNGRLWPQAPNSLSRRINLVKADLRNIGIVVEKDSLDKSDRQWTIRRFIVYNYNGIDEIIAARNNILYQYMIIRNLNYWKAEQISSERPYPLKVDDCAQVTEDDSHDIQGDISVEVNHISPYISPEENAENCAQNEPLRRSGDTGDICLLSSQNYSKTKSAKELQNWNNVLNNNDSRTAVPSLPLLPLPKVTKILNNYFVTLTLSGT